jgi:uncharacterized protein (TIGR00299 family) protein
MRIAYLDCFAGISGDMFLGALIDSGVSPAVLHNAAAAINVNAAISIEKVDRSGITSTKVHVLVDGKSAEEVGAKSTHTHAPSLPQQRTAEEMQHQRQPQTQHQHKLGHTQTHDEHGHVHEADGSTGGHAHSHEHEHGRSLSVIREMIMGSSLDDRVKRTAIRTFERLGASEAKIHNVPVEAIHFHEVGAVDAIVDIVAASAGIHALGVDAWYCSSINVGGGMVDCAHGRFPVPAPATADLLRGFPTYSADIQKELVTPTGAALLRTLVEDHGMKFGAQPAMRTGQIGYGAGTRNPKNFPNVLRLSVGEAVEESLNSQSIGIGESEADAALETVTVLETALDDLSPQIIAHVADVALQRGALDVMLIPVMMKKGRPGTLVTILCKPEDSVVMENLLLRETSTLGVRIRQDRRVCLEREHVTVPTPYGGIRVKVGMLRGEVVNSHPEFEDCRNAAAAHGVPVKQVQQAALTAYEISRVQSGQSHA